MSARKSPYADCPRCHAPLIWVHLHGKRAPVNRDPDPQGQLAVWHYANDRFEARFAVLGEPLAAPWKRYALHDPACAEVSGTQEPPRNVTQLDTWRKAQSAHNAAQRNQRGKRAAPRITGYRINP